MVKCKRPGCNAEFRKKREAQIYCSQRCRNADWKRPGKRRLKANWAHIPGSVANGAFSSIKSDSRGGTQTKSEIAKSLRFERVNEVTFKVTDGEQTNVPASHGQWAGYRCTKAIAWVICVAPGRWLARLGDQACGPSPLHEAKANAVAMAKGAAGDYQVSNPIAHLNGLATRLLGRDGGAP
jgi:hypothetical protein